MQRFISLFAFLFTVVIAFGQSNNSPNIKDLEEKHHAKVSINPATNTPSFIRFPKTQALKVEGSTNFEKAINFLNLYAASFGVEEPIKNLKLSEEKRDSYNKTHLTFEQNVDDIPVFGGEIRFHFDTNNAISAINGVFLPEVYANPVPTVNIVTAEEIALAIIDTQLQNLEVVTPYVYASDLVFFNKGLVYNQKSETTLNYKIEIRNDNDVREFLFIDAHTGKLSEQYTGTPHALHRRLYETNTGNQIWNEGDALPGSLNQWQQNEIITAAQTYHFFKNAFGYDSYDGAGAEMRTINNNPNVNCPNATWNGSTANFCNGTAADDVIAHEWGHAYTEYTSNLIYAWQTGALNESYSDIWGEAIDLLNNYEDAGEDLSARNGCNSSMRWRMGEDASAFGGAIRDMYDPTCNNDPGKVSDSEYWCNTGDNGGVHINSGVNNHLFMLLVDGGLYNGVNVPALGFTKTVHIFWRAGAVYLTNTSDFLDQADALETSCQDLLGINLEGLSTTDVPAGPSGEIITAADCQAVTSAINAVEMRLTPNCTFTPLLTKNEPNLCSGSDVENNVFFQDFESGQGDFTTAEIPSNPATWEARTWTVENNLPRGEAGSAMFGPNPVNGNCSTDLENGIIRLQSPVITIPAGRTSPFLLTFDHYVATEPNWDGGNLKYSINGGPWTIMPASAFIFNSYNGSINPTSVGNDNPMAGEIAFTGADDGSVGGSWGQSQLNITNLGLSANDNIQLRWEVGGDSCNGREGWYVDNIKICTCEAFVLPVELIDFSAKALGNKIALHWKTASEFNNAGFVLERSFSATGVFSEIKRIAARGSLNLLTNYTDYDLDVKSDIPYFYRLKQIDIDGTATISAVVKAQIVSEENNVLLYPNPTNGILNFDFGEENYSYFTVNLFDSTGKQIASQNLTTPQMNTTELTRGIYWIEVIYGSKRYFDKLLVE